MEAEEYCQRLRERLHPNVYSRVREDCGPTCHLLLVHGPFWARYALSVYEWDKHRDGPSQLAGVRREIGRALFAIPFFAEVGLYAVFCGAKSDWSAQVVAMPADKTGLHRVIVQAVHLVDLETGENALNQSAWGPIRFGGVASVAGIVNSVVVPPS